MLEKVAPQTAGQMSIATIDCTVEKSLCKDFSVRGYPTLKFALDGEVYDYPGGRSERDFLDFRTKMLRPAVESVTTVDAAQLFAATKSDDGVVFLAYHPAVVASAADSEQKVEEMLQSTHLTQVFAQVARTKRATGSFLLLDTSATQDDEQAAAVAAAMGRAGPFLCRLEANVEARCYDRIGDSVLKYPDLLSWVEGQNVPTVAALGAQNLKAIGRRGRPLCIAVISSRNRDELEVAKIALANYALKGPPSIRDKYYYGTIDGVGWARFLEQFDVHTKDSPQILILDLPNKSYWQNETYKLNVEDFLQAIEEGIVVKKSAGKAGVEGALIKVYNLMMTYRPWSVMLAVLLLVGVAVMICTCIQPGTDLRPPYPRVEEQKKEGKKEETDNDEGKKDK